MKICTLQPIKVAQALTQKKGNWKSFLSLVVLLVAVTFAAKANPVDVNAARQVGATFISGNTPTRASSGDLTLAATYTTSDGTPAFYVFNAEKNYVIVAADDCATPILGYSAKGLFEPNNLPIQLEEYLQGFVEQIQYGIDNHLVGSATTAMQWSMVRTTGKLRLNRDTRSVAPLLTDSWGQSCYYNNMCPEDPDGDCGHVVTGCTGTSMGEIMRFWGYPQSGAGSMTYTPSGYPQQSVNFAETTYDWANMPDFLNSSSTETQVNAVATLLWHCGVSLQASYGANGTSAYPSSVPNVMINTFKYSPSLHGEYRSNYSDAQWLEMVKSCLDLGRPIHYSGWNSQGGGGHSFVCDGYDNNDLLHFNFGWYGSYNNYYSISAVTPGGSDFSYSNFAVFDIIPNCESGTYYQVTASKSPSNGGTVTGAGTYECGSACTLTATPKSGYAFCSWTENGALITTEPTFSFTVMDNRAFEANFIASNGDECTLVFTLNDSYGDGWNGNALVVNYSAGCFSNEELTFDDGTTTTITRTVPNGSHVILSWLTGQYTEECSFEVSYQNGNTIYSASNPSSAFSYEFDVNCDPDASGHTLTVYDGTATSSYVPVYGFYGDAYLRCQFVMPAADLADMNGGEISQMHFYLSSPAAEAWTGNYQVYMTEITDATISDFINSADATTVYTGTLDATGETMTVVFNNNKYTYNGGNLLIGFDQTTTGNYKSVSFYGVEATGASVQGYSYSALSSVSATQRSFLPKTTFSYSVGGNETLESNLDYTTYDWQTNSGAITRTITWPDGKVNFAYTMATETNYSDRGTGIGTYDSNTDQWIPSGGRVENEKTGFGSIARYGANSIVVAAHTSSHCGVYLVPDKDNITPGCATLLSYLDGTNDPCWPNVMTSGPNRSIIHVIASSSNDQKPYYFRSQDGGYTWDKQNIILPYLTEEYGSSWGSNICYWMETTDDNCLALVVNNAWSDGMVIYSYDNGNTWQRKVFYHHPGINNTYDKVFMFPRWTSAQWGVDGELCLAYEFNSRSGEPGSGSYNTSLGGVGFWSENLVYTGEGYAPYGYDPTNPKPATTGQTFILDSAYIYHDIYSAWPRWSDQTWDNPVYFGYVPCLTDDGEWESWTEAESFNIDDFSLHGSYNNGISGMPVLCTVPGSNGWDMVTVWIAMDENHIDGNGKYYFKLFAAYSSDAGRTWRGMTHLTKDFIYSFSECVYPQATIVGNKLIVACQMDGATGTCVQYDDDDPSDNHYQGMAFNLEDLFGTIGSNDIVTIGTGTDSQFQLPVQSDWFYSLSEQIYTAEEIGRAGTISTIGFNYDYNQPFNVQVSLALKHVTKEFFEASNDMVNLSDDDFVYSGTLYATTPGWVTLALDTPFEYDGTSNLLVACYKTEEVTYGSSYKFKCTYYEEGSRALGYYNSSIIPDYTDLAGYGGWKQPYYYRNDIQLGFREAPIVLSAPHAWIDFDYMLEYEENYLNWNMPNEDVLSYNVYRDDVLVANTTDTYYDLTNLTYNLDGYRFNVTAVYEGGESGYSNDIWIYVTGKGTINGHVYEQDGVTPIQGAMVRFDGTGELGGGYWYFWYPNQEAFYSFDMPVGVYTGYAIAPGYQQTYYVGDIVISHNGTTTINFAMDERFDAPLNVVAEYYPNAEDMEAEAVQVSWEKKTALYYDDGIYTTGLGAGGSFFWGMKYDMSNYSHYSLTDVSMYDCCAHTGNILIYQGGESAPESLVYQQEYTCTNSRDFAIFPLDTPVSIDPSLPLWIVMNNIDGDYPAPCCDNTGFPDGRWVTLDGENWYDLNDNFGWSKTWMLRGYITDGRSISMIANGSTFESTFATNTSTRNNGQFSAMDNAEPHNVGTPGNADRSLQYYRVYRTDELNEGPFNIENTVLVADNLTDTYYIDETWAEVPQGSYKYGVSCVYEGNRESAINWNTTTTPVVMAPQKDHGWDRNAVTLLYEGFEDNMIPNGWTTIDADGDGYNWGMRNIGNNGSYCVTSASWDNTGGVLTPDNYLVTPQVELGGTLTFWACAQDASYAAEHFGVAISTRSNTNTNDFITIQEWTMSAKGQGGASTEFTRSGNRAIGTWYQYTVDLSAYEGQMGYVAIRHFNCTDMYYLNVDDVEITGTPIPPIQIDRESEITWSNTMEKGTLLGEGDVNITVTLNDGRSPAGTIVNFYNQDDVTQMNHPMAEVVLDETGYYAWESFRKGNYYLEVYKEGYYYIWEQVSIYEPTDLEYVLSEVVEYVSDLYVSSTGWAQWDGFGNSLPNIDKVIDFETGDFSQFAFDNSVSDYPWVITSEAAYKSSFCMKSSNSSIANSTSAIEATVTYNYDGSVSFAALCMGEGTSTIWDACSFYIDGEVQFAYGLLGSGWNEYSFDVAAGTHTFRWEYTKDGSVDPLLDAFFIDNITFVNGRGGRHYESCEVELTDASGMVIYSGTTDNNYIQLPVDDLVEGETYGFTVSNVYSSGTASESVLWTYQPCDNYEGATEFYGNTTDEGNLITWNYPIADDTAEPYDIQIGEGTGYINTTPFRDLSNYSFTQMLYRASEMEGANLEPITSIGWYRYCYSDLGHDFNHHIMIWMANVADDEVSDVTPNASEMTLVYDGGMGISTGYYWDMYALDSDFAWDGESNLLVSVAMECNKTDDVNQASWWQIVNIDFYGSSYINNDNTPYSPETQTYNTFRNTQRPATRIVSETKTTAPIGALLYRDGELLGLTSGNEYLDEGVTDEHEYSIRVVYDGTKMCPNKNIYFSMSCPQIVGDAPATYQITASVSPEDAGTVEGAGLYTEGAQCTLVATANDGYSFSNWTKDGTIVSNNPTFAFTVTEDAAYVANFSSSGNYWEVDENAYANTMSVIGVIVIDGEEQFRTDLEVGVFCGDECRGTQRPTDEYFEFVPHYLMFLTVHGNTNDELTFRVYDHSLNQELELECLTATTFIADETLGDPGEPFEIAFSSNIEITQATNFGQGWNWWSSYVEADDLMAQMKTGLGADGKQIKSQSKFTMNYGTMWMGQLNSIENDQTYMIQANNACSVELTGAPVNPADYPITLTTGWKWIGYPCTESMSVSEALAGITPTAGDQIKAQGNFATYYNNIGWMGSLRTLTPGAGYMYKLNGTSQTLVFPNGGRGELAENVTAEGNHWTPEVHAYPSNMTVMAVVELEGTELRSENYELAAFANGEVRGSAKLMYVEPLDRYFAFLTIAGDEAAELRFGLYDGLTDTECFDSGDVLVYAADAIVGTPDAPMVVRFRGTTGLSDIEHNLHVYPNPANGGERFSVSVPAGNNVRVEVVNALGVVVETYQGASAPASVTAPMTAGVYTLRITVDGKGTYSRKLVVK